MATFHPFEAGGASTLATSFDDFVFSIPSGVTSYIHDRMIEITKPMQRRIKIKFTVSCDAAT